MEVYKEVRLADLKSYFAYSLANSDKPDIHEPVYTECFLHLWLVKVKCLYYNPQYETFLDSACLNRTTRTTKAINRLLYY